MAPQIQSVAQLVADTSARLRKLDDTAQVVEDDVIAAANDAAAFLETFSDNPGRRLISIVIGAAMGLIVASALHLNVFQATTDLSGGLWGVAVTGVVMGLGSNPTHELIKALQRVKTAS